MGLVGSHNIIPVKRIQRCKCDIGCHYTFKQNNSITFADDNGLVLLFESRSYEGLKKGGICSLFNNTNYQQTFFVK